MNPRIDFPLLPTIRPYPLLALTHGLSRLYWLGTSGWCLSLMRTPLLCESIACLLFVHFPLPLDLFGLATCSATHFLTLCSMDKSLGLHSLHLISSLGWVLLGYGPSLLQFSPCFLLPLVCGSTDTPTTPTVLFLPCIA